MLSSVFALTLLLPALRVSAQVPTNASALALEIVDAQYVDEGFNGSDPDTAFGLNLTSQALLTVIYNGTQVQNGMALTQSQVASLPTIYVTPGSQSASNFSSSDRFTLTLADASALGSPDPEGNYRHYLANSLSGGSGSDFQLNTSDGTTITYYSGPGPAAGEGPHRYAWLLFQQPSTFTAPANLSTAGTAPSHWSLSSYVKESGLGALVAASFFTVENGQASYSVAPTSSVNPAILPAYASATSLVSSSASAASATASGNSKSGAGKTAVSVLGAFSVIALGLFA